MPIQLLVLDYHLEFIQVHLVDSPKLPLVLGHPWLSIHNSQIDSPSGRVLGWNLSCQLTFQQVSPHLSGPAHLEASDAPVPPAGDDKPNLSRIPRDYWDLGQVFCKQRASELPPHRSYDCAIDLLPGTTPPRGELYSLSGPETAAMNS